MTKEEIRALCNKLGTVRKLAARLGVEPSRVSTWLSGKHKPHRLFVEAMRLIEKEVNT